MQERYEPAAIEAEAQKYWEERRCFAATEDRSREKYYCLSMFPYPSGRCHMGHVRNYTIGDVLARFMRMQGRNVLQPMGWDAFGLPAENAAIANGVPPAKWTYDNIATMRGQLKSLGLAIDWRREVATCRPDYYRWNQWLFLRMLERGIAYRKTGVVNWDPVDRTVLANEQVIDGRGWRTGAPVERREIPMYYLAITRYAEPLLEALAHLPGWPDRVRTMQANWIGRSEGVNVGFPYDIAGTRGVLRVFTTRADTLMGVTFCAVAAEHPLATLAAQADPALAAFVEECQRRPAVEAELATQEKKGMPTGFSVRHPLSGEAIPVWVGNYVLMSYGEGAVMGVPAHDERDFEFAKKYGLPIRRVIDVDGRPYSTQAWEPWYAELGRCVDSGRYDGMATAAAVAAIAADLAGAGLGERRTVWRLRDWGISRQRYWGCPIPIIQCAHCGPVPVADSDLPVLLPEDLVPDGSGNPLTKHAAFLACRCPRCGAAAQRETDTMDTFVDSSWYYARFVNPHMHDAMIDAARVARWMPVDLYIGGVEHAILHLMYARFLYKVLGDFGMVPGDEPFAVLFNQGMITAKSKVSGKLEKMSKSKGNVIAPDALISRYGADTERVYTLFMGPPEKEVEWTDDGVMGAHRFLQRVWGLQDLVAESAGRDGEPAANESVLVATHRTVKRVHDDLARYHPNTAIAAMMELINTMAEHQATAAGTVLRGAYETLLRLLHPIAPHVTEEVWRILGHEASLLRAGWPSFDAALLAKQQVTLAVQVNGKLRATIAAEPGLAADAAGAAAREAIAKWLEGKRVVKVVHVPDRMVSFVVKG